MDYYLTSRSVINTNYTTTSGQVLYKVQTPFKVANRLTTISRVAPNGLEGEEDMRDQFEQIATIEWKTFKYGGDVVHYDKFGSLEEGIKVSKLFRKGGLGWYGRQREFRASNGKEYKWKLGFLTPELVRCEDSKLIARFHRKGILSKKPSFLQIIEDEEIREEILLTFIWIEDVRKERERRNRHSAGGD